MGNAALCVKASSDNHYHRDSFSEKLALDEMSLFRKIKDVESGYQNTLKLDGHLVTSASELECKYTVEYRIAYAGQEFKWHENGEGKRKETQRPFTLLYVFNAPSQDVEVELRIDEITPKKKKAPASHDPEADWKPSLRATFDLKKVLLSKGD